MILVGSSNADILFEFLILMFHHLYRFPNIRDIEEILCSSELVKVKANFTTFLKQPFCGISYVPGVWW